MRGSGKTPGLPFAKRSVQPAVRVFFRWERIFVFMLKPYLERGVIRRFARILSLGAHFFVFCAPCAALPLAPVPWYTRAAGLFMAGMLFPAQLPRHRRC